MGVLDWLRNLFSGPKQDMIYSPYPDPIIAKPPDVETLIEEREARPDPFALRRLLEKQKRDAKRPMGSFTGPGMNKLKSRSRRSTNFQRRSGFDRNLRINEDGDPPLEPRRSKRWKRRN